MRFKYRLRERDPLMWADVRTAIGIGAVAIVIVLVLWALLGCGGPASGKVYDKKYRAPYTYATNQCVLYSDSGICTVNIPTFHEEPEHFFICLDDGKEHGCNEVDSQTYHEAKVGEWYGS